MADQNRTTRTCPKHGDHEGRAKCPACQWVEKYDALALFEEGCPRCGKPLDGNGFIMWCDSAACPMQTTSHAAL